MSWEFALTRLVFQRSLGFIYFIGFLIIVNQFTALLGEKGILPAPAFLKRIEFLDSPSLFWFYFSDPFAKGLGILGLVLSIVAMTGISESVGLWFSVVVWASLWLIYLSFVNIGQTFYGFGWESLLLETGFLAIFLGSKDTAPPVIVIWLLRWVLFRLMFGAGMIKLRGDSCWRDLTCMTYHYETQPMPNPLSWFFHHLPTVVQKGSVLFNHFVELIVPWFYFIPGPVGAVAGAITLVFQLILIFSGNLSWLNYMSMVLCITCFDDSILSKIVTVGLPQVGSLSLFRQGVLALLTLGVGALSVRPIQNLISKTQAMNTSFDPLHLVNSYGAFGSVTRERMEVIVQGTTDTQLSAVTKWKEYGFKGKPGDVKRMPPLISPYHLRLDWQMWFAAMSPYYYHSWILNFVAKLLEGDPAVQSLLRENPFPESPPKFIRLELYQYHFTKAGDPSGHWWKRTRVESYLPPVSLDNAAFRSVLESQGW